MYVESGLGSCDSENEAAYEAFKASEDFVTPNLSWCVQENTIKRNKYGETGELWLTLVVREDGQE